MKQITDFTLVERCDYGNLSWLRLRSEQALPEMFAGQFVQVRIDGAANTYLRRPISIHNVDVERRELELMVAKVGEGTRTLTSLAIGQKVNMVLPLGNGFSLPESSHEKTLLVGGGVGIAPLYYLGKQLVAMGCQPTFLLGGRSASGLIRLDEYRQVGEVLVTTEDGSLEEKGFVTQHSVWKQAAFDRVYVCGPKPMMKAVMNLTNDKGVWCEMSLENMMACGLGACLCCVEDTVDGNVCVCKEGPVFNTRRLKW